MCQNRVIRSRSGWRREDHPVEPDPLEPREVGRRRRAARPSRRAARRSSAAGWPSAAGGLAVEQAVDARRRGRRARSRWRTAQGAANPPGGAGGPRGQVPRVARRRARRAPRRAPGRSSRAEVRHRRRLGGRLTWGLRAKARVGTAAVIGGRSSRPDREPAVAEVAESERAGRSRASAWALSLPFSSMFCMTRRSRFSVDELGQGRRRRPRRASVASVAAGRAP